MNSNARKILLYLFVFLVLGALAFAFFNQKNQSQTEVDSSSLGQNEFSFSGKAFGMNYQVDYWDNQGRNVQPSLDSIFRKLELLADINQPSSEVSRLNTTDSLWRPSRELLVLLEEAKKWYEQSNGALDLSEESLVKSWSFSSNGANLLDTLGLPNVMRNVGMGKISPTDSLIRKPLELKLNFNKIISGKALDQITTWLLDKGISNFHLKLGPSEAFHGVNFHEELWKTQINYLADSTGKVATGEIALPDWSISTAGDPTQFYLRDSTQVSFTLDPRTGLPVSHGLLYVAVFSEKGVDSDALADQFLIQGRVEALRQDSLRSDLDLMMIYSSRGGKLAQYISPELRKYLSFPVEF